MAAIVEQDKAKLFQKRTDLRDHTYRSGILHYTHQRQPLPISAVRVDRALSRGGATNLVSRSQTHTSYSLRLGLTKGMHL